MDRYLTRIKKFTLLTKSPLFFNQHMFNIQSIQWIFLFQPSMYIFGNRDLHIQEIYMVCAKSGWRLWIQVKNEEKSPKEFNEDEWIIYKRHLAIHYQDCQWEVLASFPISRKARCSLLLRPPSQHSPLWLGNLYTFRFTADSWHCFPTFVKLNLGKTSCFCWFNYIYVSRWSFPLTWKLHPSIYCTFSPYRFLALFYHIYLIQFRENTLHMGVHLSHEWSIWKIILVLFLSIDHPSNNWVVKKFTTSCFKKSERSETVHKCKLFLYLIHLCKFSLTLIRDVHLCSSTNPIQGDIWLKPPFRISKNVTKVVKQQILLIFWEFFFTNCIPFRMWPKENVAAKKRDFEKRKQSVENSLMGG